MKYRLLGIDVDGTLLGPDHILPAGIAEAIRAARAEGLKVCLATGRAYGETIDIWRQLELSAPFEPIILIGGALVSEPDTGRTLYQKTIPRDLANEFADALGEAGYAAMVIFDPWRSGWDYLLCETGDVHDAQRRWLGKMRVTVRRVARLAEATDIPSPLRINVVADPPEARVLLEAMQQRFDGRLNLHAIVAPNYDVMIVEGFAAEADKFNALRYVAQAYRIGLGQVIAVGDDVNDLPMVRGAGLGVAMPNAVDTLCQVADVVVEDTLAGFIYDLLAGRYDGSDET